jgi:hypothetical protein
MLFRYDLLYGYNRYLPDVYKLIPAENLLVVDYTIYRSEPARVHAALLRFLGLDVIPLPQHAINPSFAVRPNAIHRLVARLLRRCIGIRRKLGLIKGRYPLLDRIIGGKPMPAMAEASPCDAEVKDFFKHAYIAMDEAFQQHGIEKYLD